METQKRNLWTWDLIVVIFLSLLIYVMILSLVTPQRGGWLVLIALIAWIMVCLLRKGKDSWHSLLLLGVAYGAYLMIPKSNETEIPMYYFATATFWMVLAYVWLVYDTTGGYITREHWESAILILGAMLVFQTLKEMLSWYWTYHIWAKSLSFEAPNMAYRVSGGITNHPNNLAALLNAIWPLVLLRILKPRLIWARIAYTVFLLLIFWVLFVTNSRGGVLGTVTMGGLIVIYAVLDKYPILINKPAALWSSISRRDKVLLGGFLVVGLGLVAFIFWRATFTGTQLVGFESRERIWGNSIATFLNSPLFGNGAGSFVLEYARKAGLPPGFLAPDAHNLEMQILVISGIIGFGFLLLAGFLVFRFFIEIIRQISGYERMHFFLLFMFLVGMLVHNQFDYSLEDSSANTIVYAILMALALNFDRLIRVSRPRWVWTAVMGILAVFLFTTLVGINTISKGQTRYKTSLELVSSAEWDNATQSICDIAATNDSNQFYKLQCSQIKSIVGVLTHDEQLISEALQVQATALDANPWWPINRANYAGLLWWVGEYDHAFAEMQIAVNAAERNAVLHLNFGFMADRLGRTDIAESAFLSAMMNDPYLIGNPRYDQSESWQVALEQLRLIIYRLNSWEEFMITFPEAPFTSETNWALWRSLAAASIGDLELGVQIMSDRLYINPDGLSENTAAVYLYNELGDHPKTSHYVEIARMAARRNIINYGVSSAMSYWKTYYILGHVQLENGQLQEAKELLNYSYFIISNYNSSTGYNGFVYNNYIPLWDLSPTLEWGILSPELEADYQWLANKLEGDGDLEKAEQIRQWLEIQQANTLISH